MGVSENQPVKLYSVLCKKWSRKRWVSVQCGGGATLNSVVRDWPPCKDDLYTKTREREGVSALSVLCCGNHEKGQTPSGRGRAVCFGLPRKPGGRSEG